VPWSVDDGTTAICRIAQGDIIGMDEWILHSKQQFNCLLACLQDDPSSSDTIPSLHSVLVVLIMTSLAEMKVAAQQIQVSMASLTNLEKGEVRNLKE
jgi:hypothetical protein